MSKASPSGSTAEFQYQTIVNQEQLAEYCRKLAACEEIALDTEFVSEDSYRPELCLVQVNAGGELAVIDALAVGDLRPFWETLTTGDHETIVHAGRGEMEFCLYAVDRLPARLFDVQLAAGMAGIEYPAGYGTLVAKLLRQSASRHETRTDWRQRPLSSRQLSYAIEDVHFLPAIRNELHERLAKLERLAWFDEEMALWQAEMRRSLSGERWRRVSGNAGLEPRSLAIVRELWKWRDAEAARTNRPARRILRDDLIVELAKRQSADPKRIRAVRGMVQGGLVRRLDELAACIQRAFDLPQADCPQYAPREATPPLAVLGQFLFAALGSLCREAQLAPNLVGGPNDIRDLVVYRMAADKSARPLPQLASGWRAEFVGQLFDELLAGKIAVRIVDPASEHPLRLERGG